MSPPVACPGVTGAHLFDGVCLQPVGWSCLFRFPTWTHFVLYFCPCVFSSLLPVLSDRASFHRMCQWTSLVRRSGPTSHRGSCSHKSVFPFSTYRQGRSMCHHSLCLYSFFLISRLIGTIVISTFSDRSFTSCLRLSVQYSHMYLLCTAGRRESYLRFSWCLLHYTTLYT